LTLSLHGFLVVEIYITSTIDAIWVIPLVGYWLFGDSEDSHLTP